MGRNRELIFEIKERAAEVFEAELGFTLSREENSVHCPFHGEDKTPSMGVNIRKGMFNCLACGASGDVITFVMRRNELSFPEALNHCAEILGLDPQEDYSRVSITSEQREEERELLAALHKWAGEMLSYYAVAARQAERALWGLEGRVKAIAPGTLHVFRRALESDCEYQRAYLKVLDEKYTHFLNAAGDPWRQAVLFGEEYHLNFQATTIRTFNDALLEVWRNEEDAPRAGELLALSVLRQFPNKILLEKLGRGWYVDVEHAIRQHERGGGDQTGSLHLGSEDRAAEGSIGAVEGPRVGDRALAQAAREAVERAKQLRRQVREAFEREAAGMDAGKGPDKSSG